VDLKPQLHEHLWLTTPHPGIININCLSILLVTQLLEMSLVTFPMQRDLLIYAKNTRLNATESDNT